MGGRLSNMVIRRENLLYGRTHFIPIGIAMIRIFTDSFIHLLNSFHVSHTMDHLKALQNEIYTHWHRQVIDKRHAHALYFVESQRRI